MKIPPVGAELLHADRRTDMTKLIVTFHNFANASNKKWRFYCRSFRSEISQHYSRWYCIIHIRKM